MKTNIRNELTMVGIFFVGFVLIYTFLEIINDIAEELTYGTFILFAILMIFLVFYLFISSRSNNDPIIPLGMYSGNPLDQNDKEMKRICLKCGREITNETSICPECGHAFNNRLI